MAAVIPGMNEVYAKWEKGATSRGRGRPQSNGDRRSVVESGRKAWRNKFKDVPPPPHRNSRGDRNGVFRTRRPPDQPFLLHAFLGDFKRSPSIATQSALYHRPTTHRCCKCMPMSRDTYIHETVGMPDKTNVLDLPYSMWLTVRFGYPNITESVLRSHATQLAVERTVHEDLTAGGKGVDETSKEYKTLKKKCDSKLKQMFNRMKAVMSIPVFKLTGWFLHKILGSLLISIQVQNDQMKSLREASTCGKSIIYLPTHRSHLDYVLITFILWNYGIRAPYVAAGDNLNIPVFGGILRSLGGFFIRRRLDKKEGKRDHLYRAVLNEYVVELLKRGQSLEFFVEGGRSRSGKSLMPKAGLLSIVVDFVKGSRGATDGIMNKDALIVPVSISYEKIMDGNFVREQIGLPKKQESFWSTAVAIWKLFSKTFGNVRVDFGQPFSLKEYLEVNGCDGVAVSARGDSPLSFKDSTADLAAMSRSASDNSIYGIDVASENQRQLVDSLAKHVVYSCVSNAAVMSTNLMAFALLLNHRKGVTMTQLISSTNILRQLILDANRDLGLVGKTCDIIAHAARLLGPALVHIKNEGGEVLKWSDLYDSSKYDSISLQPDLSIESALQLTYYSNPVITVFQKQSIMVCALMSVVGLPLLDESAQRQDEPILVTKEAALQKATFLAELLQLEFLFISPCQKIENVFDDVFESLLTTEVIQALNSDDTYNEEAQQWTSRIVRTSMYAFNDDDDEDYYAPETQYQVNLAERDQLWLYGRSLQPFIETYWVVANSLLNLLDTDMSVDCFNQLIHTTLTERVENCITEYPEIVAQETMKNSLHSFSDMKIVENYLTDGVKMISLTEEYNTKQPIHDLIANIGSYRSN